MGRQSCPTDRTHLIPGYDLDDARGRAERILRYPHLRKPLLLEGLQNVFSVQFASQHRGTHRFTSRLKKLWVTQRPRDPYHGLDTSLAWVRFW